MDKPLVTTKFVMMQVLAEFAENLGLSRQYAEMLSHVHVLQSASFNNWQTFMVSQCRLCDKSPETCSFMHPDSSAPDSADTASANRASVSYGRIGKCPIFEEATSRQK